MPQYSHYPRYNRFFHKPILGIDYGSKVIGTAIFIPGKDPFPLIAQKIIVKSDQQSLAALQRLVLDESIEVVVFGVPYLLDGKASVNTLRTREFGEQLKKILGKVEFFEQDETLTTKAAEDLMKNSPQYNFKVDITKIDCVAATIIIEDFIRSE